MHIVGKSTAELGLWDQKVIRYDSSDSIKLSVLECGKGAFLWLFTGWGAADKYCTAV